MKPQPRPALKRAEDADLHPALSVAPAAVPTQMTGGLRRAAEPTPDSPQDKAKSAKGAKTKGKGKKFQGAGRATSDSLRAKPDKDDKLVTLDAKVPKKVRKEIRAIAKHSGTSVDAIVSQALTEWLGDPRRW